MLKKTIVLIGGGHAHVEVIRQFAMRPVDGVKLILVSEEVETPYSGMIPGLIAGHYQYEECHVSLGQLCTKAGVRLHRSKVVAIDMLKKVVCCHGRPNISYDLLSINIGSTPNFGNMMGTEFAIPIKPISAFLKRWSEKEKQLRHYLLDQHPLDQPTEVNVVVVGGGAAGVEVSLCLSHRLTTLLQSNSDKRFKIAISLVTDRPQLLENHAIAVMRKFLNILKKRNICIELNQSVSKITHDSVVSENGLKLKSDICVIATHASSTDWLSQTDLALDQEGFISVDKYLRSVSHSCVFAAGDIAAHQCNLSKNGVHAVRQGPILAKSLRKVIQEKAPVKYVPQKRTLALISTGNKSAIASYGNLALEGEWLWKLKNWIDIRWMKKYNDLTMANGNGGSAEEEMRCGGCGSKISGVVLEAVLDQVSARVKRYEPENLLVGLDSPDDSTVFSVPDGNVVVKTVDQFRSFIDDPYLLGAIAANHALNDIFAMGATPSIAMALVTLPYAENQIIKNEISQILAGINVTLEKCSVTLAGGHTGEGPEMSIGMSITGFGKPEALLRKSGLKVGDAIVLTRPLGSGAMLAAHMRAKIGFEVISKMLVAMTRTNEKSSLILQNQNTSACTDVTGFGLLGHLGEIAASSKVHIKLQADSLPVYAGALDAFSQNIFSTLHAENKSYADKYLGDSEKENATDIMFDPQTSGGFIAGIDSNTAESAIKLLKEAGDSCATIIGYVTTGVSGKISIC